MRIRVFKEKVVLNKCASVCSRSRYRTLTNVHPGVFQNVLAETLTTDSKTLNPLGPFSGAPASGPVGILPSEAGFPNADFFGGADCFAIQMFWFSLSVMQLGF
jgi:hypothetical protein